MKTIIKKETHWISRPETVEVQLFVTSDGREFKNENEAIEHQKLIDIKSVRFDNELIDDVVFHYVSNIEEIALLTSRDFIEKNKEYFDNLTLPGWVGIETQYDYNYGDSYCIYDIEDLKKAMSKTIESFNKLLEEIE